MFALLPNELIPNIIYQACTYSADDSRTLGSLSRVSHKINKLMHDNHALIVEYYTLIEVTDERTRYIYCGKRHRDNDLPAIIYADGTQYWYQHDQLHRDNDQPAIIFVDGTQYWYQHDQMHRDNGKPAVIYADGTVEYWINDTKIC